MFKNAASEFVYVRTYSRWLEDKSRRETWDETVGRYVSFIEQHSDKIPQKVLTKIKKYMLSFDVMPSMRAVWSAGEAAKQDNTTIFNCSFTEMDSVEAFAECLYILMCGTGFGFSVTKEAISKLPSVPIFKADSVANTFVIEDSKKGWADSVKTLMNNLYAGNTSTHFDYSKIRPEGTRLLTMGGRASGPDPLKKLHEFIVSVFTAAQGRKLKSIEVHDICNKIAEIVVVGGVRRSSQISLSDLDDEEMQNAKNPPFPPHRFMANNSAIYKEKPSAVEFLKEWGVLAASGSGERAG